MIDNVYGFHHISDILRAHDSCPAAGNTGGHLLMSHRDKALPGKIRLLLLIGFILHNLQGALCEPDFFTRRLELPQGDVGPGAQDISSGFRRVNLVIIFQIGGGLRKAQPHLEHVFFTLCQLQPNQLIAKIITSDSQPVKLPDNAVSVSSKTHEAQKSPPNLAKQAGIKLIRICQQL